MIFNKKEYILCAAIRDRQTEMVVCGRRHSDCFEVVTTLHSLWMLPNKPNLAVFEQGFLTSAGNFATREAAARLAAEAGQVLRSIDFLISEDLY